MSHFVIQNKNKGSNSHAGFLANQLGKHGGIRSDITAGGEDDAREQEQGDTAVPTNGSLQKFASVHANVHNLFALERHLIDPTVYKGRRSAAQAEWQNLVS